MRNLALIVLNYCAYGDCVACVDRLLSFRKDYHIIIVDNHSPDTSFEKLKERYDGTGVDVLQTSANLGYSAGNNFGILFAIDRYQADTVGIVNPDILIPEGSVISVMTEKLYSDPSYALIGGCVIDAEGNYDPSASAWDIPSRSELWKGHCLPGRKKRKKAFMCPVIAPKIAQVDCVAGCFFLAKVSCLKEMDFLDENTFLYNEENILGIKCKQKGYREVLALDQFYVHNHRSGKKSDEKFLQKIHATRHSYRSRQYLCKKYYRSRGLMMLWLTERINRVYLALAFIKNKIFR